MAAVAGCEAGANKLHDKMKVTFQSTMNREVTRLAAGGMCCVMAGFFATSLESLDSRLSIFSSAVMILCGYVVVTTQP